MGDDFQEIDGTTTNLGDDKLPAGYCIGRYRLLELLGEGGMGEVYLAEQSEPVRRRVALKVIKLGMDTRQFVARFEVERQALAVMDHPNIAHVFDGGATETGRPYFVMELVRGIPISQYADQHKFQLRQRLELFISVCLAIQHAHQKGVIHRDLKPSNILVEDSEGGPVPKIIDFGVAKAAGQSLTEKTLFTATGQIIGTLEYMSPEQADLSGLDVDTRADIYSLGVVLYELLTGDLPFASGDLRAAGFAEMQRKIRDEDPPRPSVRLITGPRTAVAAERRRTDSGTLAKEMRGDLDWIVMKALEKDRNRRYETAIALANDIQHYLRHEPISARPPSARYRALKFVRRNRLGVSLVTLLAAALLAGSLGTAVGFVRAQRQARKATTVTDFVTTMLSRVHPEKAQGREITVRDALDQAAIDAATSFADEPELEAELRSTIGSMYTNLGHFDEGREHLERAIVLYDRTLGPEHLETIRARNQLGRIHLSLKEYQAAELVFAPLVETCRSALGPEDPETMTIAQNLAAAYLGQGRFDIAEPLFVEILDARRRILGAEHERTLATMNNLAYVHLEQGRYEQAEPLFREALEIRRRTLGASHPRTLISANNLGELYMRTERSSEAEPLLREAVEGFVRVYGETHPNTADSAALLVELYETSRNTDGAEQYRHLLSTP